MKASVKQIAIATYFVVRFYGVTIYEKLLLQIKKKVSFFVFIYLSNFRIIISSLIKEKDN